MATDQITWDPTVITDLMAYVNNCSAVLAEVKAKSQQQDARLEATFQGAGPKAYYEQKALRAKALQASSDTLQQLAAIGKKALAHTISTDMATKSFFTG